jgi:opacity protein-like surface antigen
MRVIAVFAISVVGLCALGQAARAADLAPSYPVAPVYVDPDPQFEFGTGWYLRGDVSYASEDRPKLTPFGVISKSDWAYGFGGGFGYKLNSMFRVDVTGDYFQPFNSAAQVSNRLTTTRTESNLSSYDGLLNGYADLGTWYGVTPYIGAGVGFGVYDPSASVSTTVLATGARTVRNYSIADSTTFAWAAMAGLSYAFDQHTSIDLGYRHLDLGRFSTTLAGYTVNKTFTRDEVRLGLRYMID